MPANTGAIRAGRAFVEFFADPSKLNRAIDAAKTKVLAWGKSVASVGAAVGGAGAALLGPLTKPFHDALKLGGQTQGFANKFDTTAEGISGLAYAFRRAGIDGDQFGGVLSSLAERISHAADKNDELIEGVTGLRGQSLLNLPPEEQINRIADAIAKIPNSKDRIRAASEAGLPPELLPQLSRGSVAFRELKEEAQRFGFILSGPEARAAKSFTAGLSQTLLALKGAVLQIGIALLPSAGALSDFADVIQGAAIQVKEFIQRNRAIVVAVAAAGIALVAVGGAAVAAGGAIAMLAPILAAVKVAAGACMAALGVMFSPIAIKIALVTAAVAGLAKLFATYTDTGRSMAASLSEGFAGVKDAAVAAWEGISAALAAGNFELAGKVAMAGLKVAWQECILALTKVWVDFKKTVVDGFLDISNILARMGAKFSDWWNKDEIADQDRKLREAWERLPPDMKKIIKKPGASGAADAIDEVIGADQKARNKFREDQIEAAKRERDAAKAALEDATKKAKDAKAAKDSEGSESGMLAFFRAAMERAAFYKSLENLPKVAQLYEAQKGVFGGPLRGQLGYGDNTAKRSLQAQEKVADNTKPIPEIKRDLETALRVFAFK